MIRKILPVVDKMESSAELEKVLKVDGRRGQTHSPDGPTWISGLDGINTASKGSRDIIGYGI